MLRHMLRFSALAALTVALGCNDGDTIVNAPPRDDPPFRVDGVYSVTGDGQVTIRWRANQENDIARYKVYRNNAPTGTFTLIGSTPNTEFIDTNVFNGNTYYYAVSAVDLAGQESGDLSYENVFDTPRPEGFSEFLANDLVNPLASAWDFSAATTRASVDSRADIFYGVPSGQHLIYAGTGVKIQDAGYVDLVDVDFAPPAGWSVDGIVEAIVGHSYIVLTADGHYAKFEVISRGSAGVTIDWAYQIDPNNPELAGRLK